MKKITNILFLGLIILIGCKTTKQVATEQPHRQPQTLEAKKSVVVWTQSIYPKLMVGDPIAFLNSTEIVLSGDFFNQTFLLQDGSIHRTDTLHPISKNVVKLTSGVLTSMKKATNGQIQQMNVSFSENDVSYNFNFQLRTDGAFILNGNATLMYKGTEYKIKAASYGECVLMVNYVIDQVTEPISGTAEGRTVSGTKIITTSKEH